MNFFLSRDNESFRALENSRGHDAASSIEFISAARWDAESEMRRWVTLIKALPPRICSYRNPRFWYTRKCQIMRRSSRFI